MVKKENSAYLFIGQDTPSKEVKLHRIKNEFLTKGLADFNLDTLYGNEITLKELQEKLLCLPLKLSKRIVVVKDAQELKEESKAFLLKYVLKPQSKIILVLDIDRYKPHEDFIRSFSPYAEVSRFKEEESVDTFSLSRQLDLKKTTSSLKILKQLLRNGERPERILGGLRSTWERNIANPVELKNRLKLLLNCDIDIKTGRLKPVFALERLIVTLCSLKYSSG